MYHVTDVIRTLLKYNDNSRIVLLKLVKLKVILCTECVRMFMCQNHKINIWVLYVKYV